MAVRCRRKCKVGKRKDGASLTDAAPIQQFGLDFHPCPSISVADFQQLHAEGRTIIFVTHNPEIAQYSSRNITLRDGHITGDTRNEHILSAAEALARLPKQEDY